MVPITEDVRGPEMFLPPAMVRLGRILVPLVYIFTALSFIADLVRVNELAYGIAYCPLITTALFFRNRRLPWIFATLACGLDAVGAFFPTVSPDMADLIGNRILSFLAVIATAFFVSYARTVQERLAEQTRRAEAAERLKSRVLASLSEDLRTPLHGLLSVVQLMQIDLRPEHRDALARVSTAARQLLINVDNIIELTLFEEQAIEMRPVDLNAILGKAKACADSAARERQITLAFDPSGSGVMVKAAEQPIRRILDNLLAQVIAATPAGGMVTLSVRCTEGMVSAYVVGSAGQLPLDVLQVLEAPGTSMAETDTSSVRGTGLTLCRRLAQAMGGWVTADDHPSGGTALRLSLRSAST